VSFVLTTASDDGVVDVDHHPTAGPTRCGDKRCLGSQPEQEPRGDRVEVADVDEGEGPQERPQRRGRVGVAEDPAHPAVSQQGHVINAVRAGDHPATSEATFNPAFAPLSVGTVRWASASARSPARPARASTGTSPADDTSVRPGRHPRDQGSDLEATV